MQDSQRQLVERIAREVLSKLAAAGGGVPSGQAADVRPPVGVCTGDYSKFPELAGRKVGAAVSHDSHVTQETPIEEPALTGIVTAARLQDAIKASASGVAILAHDARLSPLAADFVREKPDKTRRLDHVGGAKGGGGKPSSSGEWLWWIEGRCPVFQTQSQAHRDSVRVAHTGSMTDVVKDLANGVKSGALCGGVLFVTSAAKVACYANRCEALRAVSATGNATESVEEGVRDLAANVLVVEYPRVGPKAITTLTDRVMASQPRQTLVPNLARELGELHRY